MFTLSPLITTSLSGRVFLHLSAPIAARGQRLPIDFFFQSLAKDQHERAIAVILSGMGSDGKKGAISIKGNGGIVLVQSADSAKFDSMPLSIIDLGLADVVAPAHELPANIMAYCKHGNLVKPAQVSTPTDLASDLPKQKPIEGIIGLLHDHTGHDFSLYKKSTIYRRIDRRMGIHQILSKDVYLNYLRHKPE